MIYVREINLPGDCRGFTIEDNEKNYNVYVNHLLDDSTKNATLRHEIDHVIGGDFCQHGNVEAIEAINSGRVLDDLEENGEIQYLGFCSL